MKKRYRMGIVVKISSNIVISDENTNIAMKETSLNENEKMHGRQ